MNYLVNPCLLFSGRDHVRLPLPYRIPHPNGRHRLLVQPLQERDRDEASPQRAPANRRGGSLRHEGVQTAPAVAEERLAHNLQR